MSTEHSIPEVTPPTLASVLRWLDEREAFRLTSLAEGSDPTKLGYPGWAAKMLRRFSVGNLSMVREQSPGLRDALAWLDSREADYDMATEHIIGAPAEGPAGKAAKLLRFFHAEWARIKDDYEKLEAEAEKLRVLAGHMPLVSEQVEIALTNGLEVRLVLSVGKPREPASTVEWTVRMVDQLYYCGAHDDPGFSVAGSRFIHTQDGFGKTWRWLPKPEEDTQNQ